MQIERTVIVEFVISVSNGGQLMPGAKRGENMRSFKADLEIVDGKLKGQRSTRGLFQNGA